MKDRERRTLSNEELAKFFRDVNLKMTNQRVAVYREIEEHCFHPSVEEVYERVHRYLPAISMNTVYRILTSFVEKGLLRRLDNLTYRALYDGNLDEHSHFLCMRCGAIRDVYIDNVTDLDLSGAAPDRIATVDIRLRGVCAACATA